MENAVKELCSCEYSSIHIGIVYLGEKFSAWTQGISATIKMSKFEALIFFKRNSDLYTTDNFQNLL